MLKIEAVTIGKAALSLDEAVSAVSGGGFGAVVTFSGSVRKHEKGKPIEAIEYEAFTSMAVKELLKLVEEVRERWGVKAAIRHRIGWVPAEEAGLLIACAGAHRPEAFEACRFILEEIKKKVPIWKIGFRARETAERGPGN